ncbi:MAG: class II aldolase/adducin family protein [Rhodocyclaceae bacterium]|nr:class II aldolase/adducin family protein [Rhodocyclaceae bacterium]
MPDTNDTAASPGSSLQGSVSPAEWTLRCELAAAHRLVAHFTFVDMTYNHISARCPDNPEHFLVKADNVFME